MKNWLALLCVLFLVFAMTVPARAQTPTPTGTSSAPMTVSISIAGAVSYQTSTTISSGDLKCTTLEGEYFDLTTPGATATFTSQSFTCLGQLVMGVDSQYGGVHWSGGSVEASISASDTFYYSSDFQSDGSTPLTIPGATSGDGQATSVTLGGGGYNYAVGSVTAVTNYFYVHASTKPACDQGLEKGTIVGSGTISATNEAGVHQTLTANHQYELTISGGPWNNGGTPPDRYDTAMQLYDAGNESTATWQTLADFSKNDLAFQCSQADPLDAAKTIIVFTARETDPTYTSVDWRIRVNDLAGQFGDNTGGMNYELAEISNASYGCQNQYLRGSLATSGPIPTSLPNPNLKRQPPVHPQPLTPNP